MSWFDAILSVFKRTAPAAPTLPPVTREPPPMPVVKPAALAPVALTPSLLATALGIPATRATLWAYPLEMAMARFGIDTSARRAAFLAQVGHESGRLLYVRELWGPTPEQAQYEPFTPKSKALGNTTKGDGYRYRGGGLIELTGRYNFRVYGAKIGIDLENNPDLIEQPDNAASVSAVYWSDRNLNQYADSGDFIALSKAINLGNPNSTATPNGLSDRLLLWSLCKSAFGINS
jgi:putative chitinase